MKFSVLAPRVNRLSAEWSRFWFTPADPTVLGAIRESEAEAMIAVPRAHIARILFPRAFSSIKIHVTVGRRFGWGGATLEDVSTLGKGDAEFKIAPTRPSPVTSPMRWTQRRWTRSRRRWWRPTRSCRTAIMR